jgi:hypothetical protein
MCARSCTFPDNYTSPAYLGVTFDQYSENAVNADRPVASDSEAYGLRPELQLSRVITLITSICDLTDPPMMNLLALRYRTSTDLAGLHR